MPYGQCDGTCQKLCADSCTETCEGSCKGTCSGSCTSGCTGCQQYCKGGCLGSCNSGCNTACKIDCGSGCNTSPSKRCLTYCQHDQSYSSNGGTSFSWSGNISPGADINTNLKASDWNSLIDKINNAVSDGVQDFSTVSVSNKVSAMGSGSSIDSTLVKASKYNDIKIGLNQDHDRAIAGVTEITAERINNLAKWFNAAKWKQTKECGTGQLEACKSCETGRACQACNTCNICNSNNVGPSCS